MADFNVDEGFKIYLQNGPNETHIKTVNKLLSTTKSFPEGLEMLAAVLDYCPMEVINENSSNWLEHCIVKHGADYLIELRLTVIGKFLEASFNNHELSKRISSDYLSKIVEICLKNKNNSNEINNSINVLTICMKKYNSWFTSYKQKVEAYIIQYVDSILDSTVEKAALAFLYLQQVGNAGMESINHINNFKLALQTLCSTAHNLYDTFLENVTEVDDIDRPNQEGFAFEVAHDFNDKFQVTARRFKNIIKFIVVMIKTNFQVCKEIPPMEILNVIRRGTMVHQCVTASLDNYQFVATLNNIQISLLQLLKVLILWLEHSSLPFSFIINNILINCLQRSQKCNCFHPNCAYQEAVYKVFKCWLATCTCALNQHFQKELISCILKDITPIQSSVTLKEFVQEKSNINKQTVQSSNNVNKNKLIIEKDEIKCQLALETLTIFFCHHFIRVDNTIIESVYNLVMKVFNELCTSQPPHPYKSAKSQFKLQELLISFYQQDTLNSLPFIGLSLNIIKDSFSRKNSEMCSVATIGLNSLEKICQPVSNPCTIFSITPSSNNKNQIIKHNSVEMDCVVDITDDGDQFSENIPIKTEANILDVHKNLSNDKANETRNIPTVNIIGNQLVNIFPTVVTVPEETIKENVTKKRSIDADIGKDLSGKRFSDSEHIAGNGDNVSDVETIFDAVQSGENEKHSEKSENVCGSANEEEIRFMNKRLKTDETTFEENTDISFLDSEALDSFVDEINEN